MTWLSRLFRNKQKAPTTSGGAEPDRGSAKTYAVLVVCRKCRHEYEMHLEAEGKHRFASCPECGGPVSSEYDQKGKQHSPAQAAAEAMAKAYLGRSETVAPPSGRCAVCGTDLANAPAARDNVTGALYCYAHREHAGR
jgi:hypothetical protein